MQIIDDIQRLREIRRQWQLDGKVIGLVPTMGNLHQGHLTLVEEAKKVSDIVVVWIFVNPMQFGQGEDLDAYPRTLDEDVEALKKLDVDLVFTPKVKDVYPRGLEQQTFVEVPGISYMICGASRPGHFRGVATIVCKLFNMVQPNHAFFGEKDYQQLQVIKTMVLDLSMNLQVHGVPTVRESDGLAMSSRNQYLTGQERALAPAIYQTLKDIEDELLAGRPDYQALSEHYCAALEQQGFKSDYIEIRCADTLQLPGIEQTKLVVLVAAFLGKARLIDNWVVELA